MPKRKPVDCKHTLQEVKLIKGKRVQVCRGCKKVLGTFK